MRARVIKGFYDNESHEIKEKGSLVTVNDKQGQELIALGLVIKIVEVAEKKPAANKKPATKKETE